MSIGQELLNVPMGEMIRSMAFAIAEAQLKLDQASIETAEMMGGLKTIVGPDNKVTFEDSRVFFGHEWMTLKAATDLKTANASNADPVLDNAIASVPSGAPVTTEIAVPTRVSLLELGFAPVFYSFIDTIIEVKIAIKITQESSSTTSTTDTGRSVQGSTSFRGLPFLRGSLNRTRTVSTSQVNATYSSKYSYSAEGSSLLRTKLAPVPTPAILDERIRALMELDRQHKLPTTPPTPIADPTN
jgi:hypothetical protein